MNLVLAGVLLLSVLLNVNNQDPRAKRSVPVTGPVTNTYYKRTVVPVEAFSELARIETTSVVEVKSLCNRNLIDFLFTIIKGEVKSK